MRPLSVSTVLFDGYGWDLALAEIATAGVRLVEPALIAGYVDFDEGTFSDGTGSTLAASMAANGLACLAVSAHMDLGAFDAVAAVERRLGFASTLGASFLITNAASARDETALRRNLDQILLLCERHKIILALENPGHGSGNLVGNGRAGAALLATIKSPWLRLNYDFGNRFTYSGGQPDDGDFAAARPYTAHAHVKDVTYSFSDWDFCPIGDGAVGFPAILSDLAARDPDLPISLELPLRLTRPSKGAPERRASPLALLNLRAALKRSLHFFESPSGA